MRQLPEQTAVIMLGYFALLLIFALLLSLSFYFGIREWLRPRDDAPLPVDVEYVRVEDYFGVSFRAKIEKWMKTGRSLPLVEPQDALVQALLEKPGGERILSLSGGCFGGRDEHEELIYCGGDLFLAEGSVFHKEIYALGKVETEAGVRLQAVAADGEIVLGMDNEVARWLDAGHKVLLRRGSVVHSRVSSQESIELETQVSVQSLYAPLVFTNGPRPIPESFASAEQEENPAAGLAPPAPPEELPACLNGIHCYPLAAKTWLVRGSLELPAGTCVASELVIQGTVRSGPNCCFHGSLKAGRVELGSGNRIMGSLVSGSNLQMGESGVVRESVVAEQDIFLSYGVRVGGPGKLVAVSAGRDVKMEANVAVCGKVAAGRAVVTV